ncbi:MAG: menaquinone biosynthesis protein [Chlamydiae bacterium]|nr:menaquinone biosynthesis protein [Chlamydiota bacterium]MBI3265833.1 menaquinone biosynthesis protein [Chlamydiota bacterium]
MKIAASDFLNAKPLIQGLEEKENFFFWGSPNACASALVESKVDFSLIPSIEYARMSGLSIVPNVTISSKGPVKSVILFLKKPLSQVRHVAVDERSRTAVTLLKILTKEFLNIDPEYKSYPPVLKNMLQSCDAALLIGDQALEEGMRHRGEKIDLGEAWNQFCGLPFTYAFWVGKEDVESENVVRLIEAKDQGIQQIALLSGALSQESRFTREQILDYFLHSICYDESRAHRKGLDLFYDLAFKHHLIHQKPTLRFYEYELEGHRI